MFEPIDFKGCNVLVVGDVMLDVHHHGRMERSSAEAPICIHDVEHTKMNAGGAANVAINLKALGMDPLLLGLTGHDHEAGMLEDLLKKEQVFSHHLLGMDLVSTTVKTRFYVEGKQVFRSDRDGLPDDQMQAKVANLLMKRVEKVIGEVDMVLMQDYNKGVCNPYLIPELLALAFLHKKPVLVDPKVNHVGLYENIQLLKPNLREFCQMMQQDIKPEREALDIATAEWMERHQVGQMLITLSDKGIYYNDGFQSGILSGYEIDHADVSGAGDTVLAVTAACLMKGYGLRQTAQLANAAGAYVCSIPGIVPARWEGIAAILEKDHP